MVCLAGFLVRLCIHFPLLRVLQYLTIHSQAVVVQTAD